MNFGGRQVTVEQAIKSYREKAEAKLSNCTQPVKYCIVPESSLTLLLLSVTSIPESKQAGYVAEFLRTWHTFVAKPEVRDMLSAWTEANKAVRREIAGILSRSTDRFRAATGDQLL